MFGVREPRQTLSGLARMANRREGHRHAEPRVDPFWPPLSGSVRLNHFDGVHRRCRQTQYLRRPGPHGLLVDQEEVPTLLKPQRPDLARLVLCG